MPESHREHARLADSGGLLHELLEEAAEEHGEREEQQDLPTQSELLRPPAHSSCTYQRISA